MKLKPILLLTLCLIIPTVGYATNKKPKKCGATSFSNCPLQGCGGDPQLNERKNTEEQPSAVDIEKVTRSRFAKLKFPKTWKSGTPRTLLEGWGEGTPVEYEAYLIKVIHYTSGIESCNCNLKKEENNDFHLVTVNKKSLGENDSITGEISPRIRLDGWTFSKLKDLCKKKAYIKLTGYLMLDTQHVGKPTPKRLTHWEIHPVTSFQVCTASVTDCKQGTGWVDLASIPEP